MTIKELLSVLDTESANTILIIKNNEILWGDSETTTIPCRLLDCKVKSVAPQCDTNYYEDSNGEMCEWGNELSMVIEIY